MDMPCIPPGQVENVRKCFDALIKVFVRVFPVRIVVQSNSTPFLLLLIQLYIPA